MSCTSVKTVDQPQIEVVIYNISLEVSGRSSGPRPDWQSTCARRQESLSAATSANGDKSLRLSSVHCRALSSPFCSRSHHTCGPPCAHDNGFLGAGLTDFPDVEFIDVAEEIQLNETLYQTVVSPTSKSLFLKVFESDRKAKKQIFHHRNQTYDPIVHCGVFDENVGGPCLGTLSCCRRGHNLNMKQLVPRPQDFDELKRRQKRKKTGNPSRKLSSRDRKRKPSEEFFC